MTWWNNGVLPMSTKGGCSSEERRLKSERARKKGRESKATDACWRVSSPARSKVPCDPKGRQNVFIPFPTPVSPRLIRKASHDTSDLFPPFLGIILYIQNPTLSLSLFLFLSPTVRTPRTPPTAVVALETLARNHPSIRRSSRTEPSAVSPEEIFRVFS